MFPALLIGLVWYGFFYNLKLNRKLKATQPPSILIDKNRIFKGDEIQITYSHQLLRERSKDKEVYIRLVCAENIKVKPVGREGTKYAVIHWESDTLSVTVPDATQDIEIMSNFTIPQDASPSKINDKVDVFFSETVWYVQVGEIQSEDKIFYDFIIIIEDSNKIKTV